jgi:aryl sulfotransferase
MTEPPRVRYTSSDDDNMRWEGFPFRDGDIVISTRSKSGTTWMQMICALLVFQNPELPAPLSELSPWIDHSIEPVPDVVARLQGQTHRRFVKSHTPLDGLPLDPRATYVVVARQPLDMAVSLYHQGDNIDRARLRELTGATETEEPQPARPPVRDWLLRWIDRDVTPVESLDSLPGVVHHVADAWSRRETRPNVILVHYSDLIADLDGEMRKLAGALDLSPPGHRWAELVAAASFAAMRERASTIVPNRLGVLKDSAAFFRRGSSGAGRELLTDGEYDHYVERLRALAEDDVVAWLNR